MKNVIMIFVLLAFIFISLVYINIDEPVKQTQICLSELNQHIEKKENKEIITFVDECGVVTFAADVGYAKRVKTRTESGILEQYYDELGNPAIQQNGCAEILREYDEKGNDIRIIYFGIDGKVKSNKYGYASVSRVFDENRRLVEELYYDEEGRPVCTEAYGYGRKNKYNEQGEIVEITYLDEYGAPMMTKKGYAIINRIYYRTGGAEKGKVQYEFYYDENKNPVSLSLGQYGVYKMYDEYGQESMVTYLDIHGKPTITKKGYSTVMRDYNVDGTLLRERYFDIDGNPYTLSEGQAGRIIENGKTTYLSTDGSKRFNLRNLLHNSPKLTVLLGTLIILFASWTQKKQMPSC